MHADTIDTGATISVLRAFGPPDVVEFADGTGTDVLTVTADKLWTVIRSVAFTLIANGSVVGGRQPVVTWFGADGQRLALAIMDSFADGAAAYASFVGGVLPAGSPASGVVLAPLPEVIMLPGHTAQISFINGQVGDLVQTPRVVVQRYKLIVVDELIED